MSGSRVARWLATAGIVAVAGRGCLDVGAFACDEDTQCDVVGGACIEGWCAEMDESCPGNYRYVERAPAALAGDCTALPSDTTGSTSGTSAVTVSTTVVPTTSGVTSGTSDSTTMSVGSSGGETSTESTIGSTGAACEGERCTCALDVAVGGNHTCAIRTDGSVVCWGQNQFGQLGDGEATDEVAWPQVVDVGGATAARIAANSRHTCMVAEGDGSVWCWGRNDYGASAPTLIPALVVGPTSDTEVVDPFELDLGYDHTCSADAVGGLTCWGRNNAYQLGSMDEMPGPVSTGPHVTTLLGLAVGHHHGCLWDDAQVLCWGSNDNGQIGVLMPNRVETPTVVAALPGDVVSVAAGTDHTCAAVDAGASVYCWGRNDVGQLGNASGGMTYEPTLVPGDAGSNVGELVARENTTCAWLDDGEIWCWGGVRGHALGTDVPDDVVLVPPARVMVPEMDFGMETIERLGLGSSHMCAVTNAMSLWCWGSDNQHQLGPVAPLPGDSAVEVNLECPR